jgi:ABC-type proline/glycine betaine transport system ATPase subunit
MEALAIATRIAVLDQGKLEALVTPADFANVTTPTARAFLETLTPAPASLPPNSQNSEWR